MISKLKKKFNFLYLLDMDEIRINTERLLLRHLSQDDAADLFSYRSKLDVYRYQQFRPTTVEDARVFINRTSAIPGRMDTWYQLGIIILKTNEFIGDTGIYFLPPEARQVELGITLKPSQQMQGFATEALSWLIDYLFRNMSVQRIICSVDPRNKRSIRLMNRLGFRQEAHFHKSLFQDNEWQDDLIFAILEDEWHFSSE
jgi:RimJ/RimL family protein N-acetyltransferase